jgi:hypothetical protein
VSDTLERMASKGVPMKRPPATVLIESLPSVLKEATVNLGELDCALGGEPDFALGVALASTGTTMMVSARQHRHHHDGERSPAQAPP